MEKNKNSISDFKNIEQYEQKKIIKKRDEVIKQVDNNYSVQNSDEKEDTTKRDKELNNIEKAQEYVKNSGKISIKTKFILTIVVLSVVILILTIYGAYITFAVYLKYYHTTLGENLEFNVKDKGIYVKSITYPTSLLTTLPYDQEIIIKADNLSYDLYVRAKIVYTDYKNNVKEVEVKENENWLKSDDGYFYYKSLLKSNETINLVDKIKIEESNKKVINSVLTVIVETLPQNFDISSIWEFPIDYIS